ncbi:MAG: tetratricopeptide repeat protein [Deltaproteobacteria bacterium]|nr:tetratricopeptide repeat protein [Candidatus Zymogenaceae bacterium]
MSTVEEKFVKDEEFLRLFKQGRTDLDQGNYDSALQNLEEANKLSPGNEAVQNLLGLIYFRLEIYNKCESVYRELVKKNPDMFTLRANLGLVYFKEEKYFDAVRELNEAVNLKQDYARAHNYLGLVYTELGKYKSAREEFLRAGSRTMAKKVDEVIAGNRDPSTIMIDQRDEGDTPQGAVPVGDLSLDPELKQMLDDFRQGKSLDVYENSTQVEHIGLKRGTDGLLEAETHSTNDTSTTTDTSPSVTSTFSVDTDQSKQPDLQPNILNIDSTGISYGRVGGLIAVEGDVSFNAAKRIFKGKTAAEDLGGDDDPLVEINGVGRIMLSTGNRMVKIITLSADTVFYIKESAIMAFQSGISWENGAIRIDDSTALEIVHLKGAGDVAIQSEKTPVIKEITKKTPLKVNASSIIGWEGKIIPKVTEISQKKGKDGHITVPFIELNGEGKVIIE